MWARRQARAWPAPTPPSFAAAPGNLVGIATANASSRAWPAPTPASVAAASGNPIGIAAANASSRAWPAPTRTWCAALWLLTTAAAADGELGQRVLGSVGLDAGTQSPEGGYAGDRFFYYSADRLLDRNGKPLPVKGLDIDAYANVIGVSGTIKPDGWPYLSAAFAVPVA